MTDEEIGAALLVGLIAGAVVVVAILAAAVSSACKSKAANEEERHRQSMMALCLVLGLVFWPLLIVAVVLLVMGPRKSTAGASAPDVRTPAAREMLGDGPGVFLVCGVDRETGYDTALRIRAESPANARVKAEMQGVLVTKIDLP